MADKNPAQIIESSLKKTALGLLLLTISYGLSILTHVSSSGLSPYMGFAQKAIGILVILIVLPAFYQQIKLKTSNKGQCNEHDNYMSEAFRYASGFAFSLTFVSLVAIEMLGDKLLSDIPLNIIINGVEFIALGSFTTSFYLKLNSDSFDDADDEFGDETSS
jgi:hypothetical protein